MKLAYSIVLAIFTLLSASTATAQEDSARACADGIDNDGDGLVDCADDDCVALPNDGCATCTDGASFADVVLGFEPSCPTAAADSSAALGVSDFRSVGTDDGSTYVSLGEGGRLRLGFTDNVQTNSGDEAADLWVFEIGPLVEACVLAFRPLDTATRNVLVALAIPDADSNGYFELDTIQGARAAVDLDARLPGQAAGTLRFDAIEIVDVVGGACSGTTPGADIDAVCALSSSPVSALGTTLSRSLRVAPTLTDGAVTASWTPTAQVQRARYQVIALDGRTVAEGAVSNGGVVELSALPAGAYLVRLRFGASTVVRRVVRR